MVQLVDISARGVAALAVIAMGLSLFLIWSFTGGYAVHLCGWEALLQCDQGTRLFWLVPITVGVLSLIALSLLVLWTKRRISLGPGLALAVWLLTLFPAIIRLQPRTFGQTELIAAGIWGTAAISIVYWGATSLWREHAKPIQLAALVLWIGFLGTLAALPAVLQHAYLY